MENRFVRCNISVSLTSKKSNPYNPEIRLGVHLYSYYNERLKLSLSVFTITHFIGLLIVNDYLYLLDMKRHSILIVLLLVISLCTEAKKATKTERVKTPVCLTLQAENGSVRQKVNEDGTITCTIKPSDVIRVTTILLNGEDVSNQLDNNKLTLPLLSENATLEIVFEEIPYFSRVEYNTIAMN